MQALAVQLMEALGLGSNVSPLSFLIGIFLACAAAAYAMASDPKRDRRKLTLVFVGAFLFAYGAAAFLQSSTLRIPIPIGMGIAGFLSASLTKAALNVSEQVESKSDDIAEMIADRIIPKGTHEEPIVVQIDETPAPETSDAKEEKP